MNTAQTGLRGERVAARYLRKNGYDILERNLHLSHQEIDIIAQNKQFIVFVEVKTRILAPDKADRYTVPSVAVTRQKQEFLLRAARRYLSTHPSRQQPRMDVIEVYLAPEEMLSKKDRFVERVSSVFGTPARKVLKINHIENAFGTR